MNAPTTETKRRYPIVASRWYNATECASIAKILKAGDHRALRDGAWGINLARAVDPYRELTELVSAFR